MAILTLTTEMEATDEAAKSGEEIAEHLSRQKFAAIAKVLQATVNRYGVTRKQLMSVLQQVSNEGAFSPEEAGNEVVKSLQLAEGGAWTSEELRKQWHLTPATLHKRRKDFRMVYWRDPQNHFHYPKWQFTEAGSLLPGISEVLQVFKSKDEWRVMRYFLAKRTQLGGIRPLDLLRIGSILQVVEHAKIHADENTW